MKKSELKTGYLVETKENGLQIIMPIMYEGEETLALVDDLKSYMCQQLDTYDVFERETVLKVYGLPKNTTNSVWRKISIKDRDVLWDCKEQPKLIKEDKAFLENIIEESFYIARDDDNDLYLYISKPYKEENVWFPVQNGEPSMENCLNINKNLFTFIKWEDEEPYSKENLMKLIEL